jgi:hypothetical protein
METIDVGWSIELPLDFVPGETYIVKARSDSGLWASLLITAKGYDEDSKIWDIKLETVLDGSPGLVEGYDGGN